MHGLKQSRIFAYHLKTKIMTVIIILQTILMCLNALCGVIMYKDKSYKVSCFNWFATGSYFIGLIHAIFNFVKLYN